MRGTSLRWTSSDEAPARHKRISRGEKETRDLARARQRSQSGSGATAFLRVRPVDSARTIPASQFATAGKRFLGIEEFLAARCPCCGEAEVNTQHARLCHPAGAQVNQHQPLVHALSRTLKSMSVRRHQVESGAPFHADRDLRMDIVIEAGGLRDATAPEYRDKSILLNVTYADPQAGVHMRVGSADRNGSAASTSEARKRNHYVRSSGTGVLRRTQLQTRHPRGGKLWAPRQRRQRPDRSGGGKHRWRDGRTVPSAERRVQGATIPNNLCDHSGRDFAQSSSI